MRRRMGNPKTLLEDDEYEEMDWFWDKVEIAGWWLCIVFGTFLFWHLTYALVSKLF